MGEDSNRTFRAGVWLERGLEFGTWNGCQGILKDPGWLVALPFIQPRSVRLLCCCHYCLLTGSSQEVTLDGAERTLVASVW